MLVNMCSHEINVIGESGVVVLHPSGNVARVSSVETVEYIDDVSLNGSRLSVVTLSGAGCYLPEPQPGVWLVVSNWVRLYCKEHGVRRTDLLSPDTSRASGAIYSEGRVVAITRFLR